MDNLISKRSFKVKSTIIFLAVAGLVLTLLGSVSHFLTIHHEYWYYNHNIYLRFCPPNLWDNVSFLLSPIPYVWFLFSVLGYRNKMQMARITVGLMVLYPIFIEIAMLIGLILNDIYFVHSPLFKCIFDFQYIIVGIVALCLLTDKRITKILLLVFTVSGIVNQIYAYFDFLTYAFKCVTDDLHTYVCFVAWPARILGAVVTHIALYIFCTKNSDGFSDKFDEATQGLKKLKAERKKGTISIQEYQSLKADIIKKL